MEFLELAKHRYSARKYKNKEIEEDLLNYVLESGRIAPSANNTQPWVFIVVKNENKDKLRECYHREWFNSAPVYIVICGNHQQSWKRASDGKDHCDIDASIATDHMTLAATEKGLATCWVCNFNTQMVTALLGLPEHIEPIAILSVGYPDDSADIKRHGTKRKKFNDVVFYEGYK
ncbi:MAG: nitroreductase [Bacteroidetes bacterium 4572_117]|nr:MAG: nitroreductase [Bacteroidetes bacterium 4572_117]